MATMTTEYLKQMMHQTAANASQKNVLIETGNQYRKKILTQHNMMYSQAQLRESQQLYQFNATINADMISCDHVCTKPLPELQPIHISELKVNEIHNGRKLEATIITKPLQMIGCVFVIEDAQQNVLVLSLYNYFRLHQTLNHLSSSLPIGTKIVVKEPYCKKSCGGTISIRIDNPHSNFIVNDPSHAVIYKDLSTCADAHALKEKGNECVKEKRFGIATKFYSKALAIRDVPEDLRLKLLSNRMLCLLKQHRFKQAIIDGKEALALDDGSMDTKIRYRLASALTGSGRYMESWLILEDPQHPAATTDEPNVRALSFRTTRNYNESIDNDIEYDYSNVDWREIANYYDDIKIKYINKTKGRGIVSTSYLKKGQRILMETCTAFGLSDKHFSSNVNTSKMTHKGTSKSNLIQNMVEIYLNGNTVDKYRLSLLHSGHRADKNINNIPQMNVFKYYELPKDVKECDVQMLSVNQMEDIADKNAFVLDGGSGVFGVASFFNHSANPNATYCVVKKRIYVTLIQDVRKGQEICIRYSEKGIDSWID
eukprot:178908_1